MANVTVTPVSVSRSAGVNVTDNDQAVTSADVYFITNNGNLRLIFTNAAGSNNVTIKTHGTVDGNAITDLVVPMTASKVYVLGPFPPSIYNDSLGRLEVTVSANADLIAVRG